MVKILNEQLITNANEFIKMWNGILHKYGYVSVADVIDFLCNPNIEPRYTDSIFGWVNPLTTDNFVELKNKHRFYYRLNLPEPRKFY